MMSMSYLKKTSSNKMKRMSFEIFNNRSDFIHKEFKIRNIDSSLSSREFKSFLKESFINPDSIFDFEDIFSINKGLCTFKVYSCKRLQSLKSSFSMGIPSRINLWRFS